MERSSPKIRCHFSTPTLCWVRGMAWTISFSRAMRWGGRAIVMLMESTIHPSMVWQVDQDQSTALRLFRLGHIVRQPFEVVQGFVDAWGQGDPFSFDVAKGLLHLTE